MDKLTEINMTPALTPPDSGVILHNMTTETLDAETDAAQLSGLIQRIASGCEASLGLFYEKTLSRVYGLALRITQRRDLAEEVCVETYWQVWREALRFEPTRGHPLAWLMVMARSRALDALRRIDPAEACADPGIYLAAEVTAEGSALEQLLAVERHTALYQALEHLTPIQRQLIALAFYQDMSHQEISAHTGLPLGTVKSHIKRAQDNLRSTLNKQTRSSA